MLLHTHGSFVFHLLFSADGQNRMWQTWVELEGAIATDKKLLLLTAKLSYYYPNHKGNFLVIALKIFNNTEPSTLFDEKSQNN